MKEKLDTIGMILKQADKMKPRETLSGKKVFFTSDTHFNHARVLCHCNRPFRDLDEMNEALIYNWNRVVGKNDLVFHLGDFVFGSAAAWNQVLDRLNGRIVLIAGNHDIALLRPELIERFEHVAFEMYVVIDNQPMFLNHHPFLCYGNSHGRVWQLHGHIHSRDGHSYRFEERLPMFLPTQYDVGVDNNNYTPVSFEQVKEIINQQIKNQNEDSIHE